MKNIIAFFLFCILLYSCQKTVTGIEVPQHTSKITISANLILGDTVTANIGSSLSSYTSKSFPNYTDAKVYLLENDVVVDTLLYAYANTYTGNHIIKPGEKYTIKASAANLTEAEGSTVVPLQCFTINNLTSNISTFNQYGSSQRSGDITFTLNQLVNSGQGYVISLVDKGNEMSEGFFLTSTSPIFNDGEGFWSSTELKTYASNIGNSAQIKISIDTSYYLHELDVTDSLILQIKCLNTDKLLFAESMEKYQNTQDNPFAEAVLIYNNIQNGYGIVMGEYNQKIMIKP